MDEALTLRDAAERVGVSPATLRRWARTGVVPGVEANGGWNSAAVAHARIVARLRERGHPLDQIRAAGEQGRLAYGYIEELFSTEEPHRSLDEVADDTGLEPALIERFWGGVGLPTAGLDQLTDEDTQALRYVASILDAGFPARRLSAAHPGLRSGTGGDRRRRGAPVPPLRPRAADAEGGARPRHRR